MTHRTATGGQTISRETGGRVGGGFLAPVAAYGLFRRHPPRSLRQPHPLASMPRAAILREFWPEIKASRDGAARVSAKESSTCRHRPFKLGCGTSGLGGSCRACCVCQWSRGNENQQSKPQKLTQPSQSQRPEKPRSATTHEMLSQAQRRERRDDNAEGDEALPLISRIRWGINACVALAGGGRNLIGKSHRSRAVATRRSRDAAPGTLACDGSGGWVWSRRIKPKN